MRNRIGSHGERQCTQKFSRRRGVKRTQSRQSIPWVGSPNAVGCHASTVIACIGSAAGHRPSIRPQSLLGRPVGQSFWRLHWHRRRQVSGLTSDGRQSINLLAVNGRIIRHAVAWRLQSNWWLVGRSDADDNAWFPASRIRSSVAVSPLCVAKVRIRITFIRKNSVRTP